MKDLALFPLLVLAMPVLVVAVVFAYATKLFFIGFAALLAKTDSAR